MQYSARCGDRVDWRYSFTHC